MRKTTTMAAAGTLFAAALLTGCGGDDNSASAYCDTMKDASELITSFTGNASTPDFDEIQDFVDKAKELADQAPAAVEDDWKTMVGGMDDLAAALDEVGLKLEDLGGMLTGEMPEGIDQEQLLALGEKLQGLAGEEMTKAGEAIGEHAEKECGLKLS